MAVSEEDVREEEIIQEDFQKAEVIFKRIIEKRGLPGVNFRPLLFALCLVYCRQLKHHKYEEAQVKR